MSLKTRAFWVFPAVILASWLAVRSLSASGRVVLDDPPLTWTSETQQEIRDPALSRTIARFAEAARAERR